MTIQIELTDKQAKAILDLVDDEKRTLRRWGLYKQSEVPARILSIIGFKIRRAVKTATLTQE